MGSYNIDKGLLVLRVGIGIMFIGHGLPKLLGGAATWAKVGSAMQVVGIGFFPEFWGLMAALAEAGGGLLLALGLLTRPATAMLAFTMFIASLMHLSKGDGFFAGSSHAIESLILFVAIFLMGPGKHSLDERNS